ncbi:hypothetical protein [uncultured Cloacibacillus sp.]|uniref:hypothetical protein n=1 Tax=uncultured Cloacibacillus sp. TaxID=889794 RepID=UPI0026DD0148|nr:hypothetical protein [uncultured Cloacibacillus sp.]
MDIEQRATSAIIDAISRSDYLKADIHSGDKKLSWDGEIEVYRKPSHNHSKRDFWTRIPVQIKGKLYKKANNDDKLTYQVSTSDLRNYLNDGGVIYFVVKVFDNCEKQQPVIFYAPLLPFDLKMLLKNNDEKQKISISLLPFHEDIDDMTRIIMHFANNMFKQRASINEKTITLSDIKNSKDIANMIENYSFSCVRLKGDIDVYDSLLHPNADIYVYAHTKLGITIPIIKLPDLTKCEISINGHINANVAINNYVYYKEFIQRYVKTADKIQEFYFGKSIKITCAESAKNEMKLFFSVKGTLSERINDTKFIIALLKERYIEIDGEKFQVGDITENNSKKDTINKLEKLLEWLLDVQELLKRLDISEELDYGLVTLKDEQLLHLLMIAILEGKTVRLTNVSSIFNLIKIGNLNICLSIFKARGNCNEYYVGNFFDSGVQVKAKGETGNESLVSYYTFFKREILLNCSNLNFSKMLDDIKSFPMSKIYADRLINLLLELLHAYDESGRQDVLDAAIEIAEWLKNIDCFTPDAVLKLNYYQTILRRRELTQSEIIELVALTEEQNLPEEVYTGAHLLLKNQASAEVHFNKLASNLQREFEKYPIYRFWRHR